MEKLEPCARQVRECKMAQLLWTRAWQFKKLKTISIDPNPTSEYSLQEQEPPITGQWAAGIVLTRFKDMPRKKRSLRTNGTVLLRRYLVPFLEAGRARLEGLGVAV